MNYAFISGIPTAGKSFLARKISKEMGLLHVDLDDARYEMRKNKELRLWVDFFLDKNEAEYWETTSCEAHWENMKLQSAAFWPILKQKIGEVIASGAPAIFETVNILPHLAAELPFGGVYLLGESYEATLERNIKIPRWGLTRELQEKEAHAFYYCEGPRYKAEAEQYGFKSFTNVLEAENELKIILSK